MHKEMPPIIIIHEGKMATQQVLIIKLAPREARIKMRVGNIFPGLSHIYGNPTNDNVT